MKMERIVLIDGLSILNRAFYGVPPLSNAEGHHTNAIYGFLNIMFKILEEEKPNYLAVAFDVKAPTFRHEIYEEYKGTRKGMPDELREQVPAIKEVLKAMKIKIYEQAGYEADDILGTLAKKAEASGNEVTLVSGDRDLLQIASDHIKISIPKTKMGKTETVNYYSAQVVEEYGVSPRAFIDVKALMGDSSDNIPGVPKVGEKTASALIAEYGSLDAVYEHLEEIKKNSIRESLREHKDLAYLSQTLATIKIDCELDFDYENGKAEGFFTEEAYTLCKRFELKNILKRFDETTVESVVKVDLPKVEIIRDFVMVEEIFVKAGKAQLVGIYLLEEDGEIFALSMSFSNHVICVPIGGFVSEDYLKDQCRKLSAVTNLAVCHIKNYYPYLQQESTSNYFDLVIGSYLVNPLKSDYDDTSIAMEYLDLVFTSKAELLQKRPLASVLLFEEEKVYEFAGVEAYICEKAVEPIKQKLKAMNMESLFEEVEMPLSLELYKMEQWGIKVEKEQLQEYGARLHKKIQELETEIWNLAGEKFNINSPKQLGEILFEKLQLEGAKKTKTGYSTAAEVLEKLVDQHEIIKFILEYRALTKLKSTYADGLATVIAADGRIHTKFQQTITATGRLSSTEPNLQNIPMRTELGREIRKVFVPEEGFVFVDADYSQIELRILAHMSGDQQLIEAYAMEEDIHRITASKVFHTPFEEVTDLQRRNAKAVNFGIVYGISSFGLSQDLSISTKEAKAYIDQYFATYPEVKKFLERVVEEAKVKGYVETMFHRRRPVPEISSSNFMQRSFGERIAMNSPIQGTAADIMKIAMIRVGEMLRAENLKSRMILQVHDELLIEAAKEEVEMVSKILYTGMKEAVQLLVKLEVDMHEGNSWYESK